MSWILQGEIFFFGKSESLVLKLQQLPGLFPNLKWNFFVQHFRIANSFIYTDCFFTRILILVRLLLNWILVIIFLFLLHMDNAFIGVSFRKEVKVMYNLSQLHNTFRMEGGGWSRSNSVRIMYKLLSSIRSVSSLMYS